MEKKFYSILFLTFSAIFIYGCVDNKTNKEEADSVQTLVDEISAVTEDVTAGAIEFITAMYNERSYEDDEFLERHCTPEMLNKLKADCEYEGGGYATWDFRSGAQDGPNEQNEIISVTPQNDNWYKYEFYDMGLKDSHEIRVTLTEGIYMIEDLK